MRNEGNLEEAIPSISTNIPRVFFSFINIPQIAVRCFWLRNTEAEFLNDRTSSRGMSEMPVKKRIWRVRRLASGIRNPASRKTQLTLKQIRVAAERRVHP